MAVPGRSEKLFRLVVVRGYAELARLGGVNRARITQIMDLLNLAPEIQEEILFLPRITGERGAITEGRLRSISNEASLGAQ